MPFTEFEEDLLRGELVRILGLKKPPYNKKDKVALRRGVELLRDIQKDIVSPNVRLWIAQNLSTPCASGVRGTLAMKFFGLDELKSKDVLEVMAMSLELLAGFDRIEDAALLELHNFFLYPQVPVP